MEGYVVGDKGTILRTLNGGRTWVKARSPVTNTLNRVDFTNDKNGWIVGSKGTVLRSFDKGQTWTKMDSITSNSLYGLYMTKKYGWSVGKDGVIIKYAK